ncbi:ABC transporter permease [Methanofollis formosanus]|uniref:ABC transporter permease n=1 Tax=Methanofollis formosanus TaxID=299308 RepID=A0A8G1EF95_9EURY|nr:ABC transporter permease subunit [Methanofollis formosanus]QYZ77956.1 ABC transporter permease [Methanofollis formosanus]
MGIFRCMIVAQKEFVDHLTSKRFFVIMALFLIILIIGMYQGLGEYNENLAAYQEKMTAVESGTLTGWTPDKPSILSVFSAISDQVVIIGAVLAIAIGFDLVSKEKETKTLKTLLSHPIYRDEVINGKAIGGSAAILLAIGVVLLVSLAMLLIVGILPTIDEFSAILTFGVVSVLFLLVYFTLALTLSTLAPDSGSALIATLVVFIILSSLLPIAGEITIDTWAGEQPEAPFVQTFIMSGDGALISTGEERDPQEEKEVMMKYEAEAEAYYEKKMTVTAIVEAASPQTNYKKIIGAIVDPYHVAVKENSPSGPFTVMVTDPDTAPPHFMDVLAGIWGNIVLLLALPGVLFLTAYLCFMRIDVR